MMSAPASRYSRWMPRDDRRAAVRREQVVVALQVARPVGEPLAAVVGLVGPVALDHRAHRAVEHQDPLAAGARSAPRWRRGGGRRVGHGVLGGRRSSDPSRAAVDASLGSARCGTPARPAAIGPHCAPIVPRPVSAATGPPGPARTPAPTPGCARDRRGPSDRDRGHPRLIDPVVIAAFEGWNDAADAASGAVDHLELVWDARAVAAIDPEDFYDFQVNRPTVVAGRRRSAADHLAHHRISVARRPDARPRRRPACAASSRTCAGAGSAPSCSAAADELGVPDRRHARRAAGRHAAHPADPGLRHRQRAGVGRPAEAGDSRATRGRPASSASSRTPACRPGIPAVSFWAAVPHYVAQPPCPKATLALLAPVEELLEVHASRSATCPRRPSAWEQRRRRAGRGGRGGRRVRPRPRGDPGHRADLPEASGEAIAREFERYLRRRGSSPN